MHQPRSELIYKVSINYFKTDYTVQVENLEVANALLNEIHWKQKPENMEVETRAVEHLDSQPCCSRSLFTSASKLGNCEVCASKEAQYTCPRCEVKTCSLKCNKLHKLELECTGERDRTKYIPLNKFSNMDLSSDYKLLEEISRSIELSKKTFGKRMQNNIIPRNLYRLRNAASQRNTTLKFLPYKFARHNNNTSELKKSVIYWHIEWVFVNADNLKLYDTQVPETETIARVLSKYLVKQEDEVVQERLQYYQSHDVSGLRIFLKAEQKAGKKFFELDSSTSLKDALRKRLIIEYPTIHVVFKDHGYTYNIIDSDDETDIKDVKPGKSVVDTIVTNNEEDDNLYKSLKNLLFVSEYSEEEMSE